MSKPILSTSFLNQDVTCSPADGGQKSSEGWSNVTRAGVGGGLCRDRGIRTWSAELAVLLLLTGIHAHARLVEGKGEEVVQAGGGARHGVQPLQPLLALLKGGELTPGETDQRNK